MAGRRLSLVEREEIRAGLERGVSLRRIAAGLGRSASTVSREVRRNRSRWGYRAVAAQRWADRRACRPKIAKLVADAALAAEVRRRLELRLSPAVVARQLTAEGSPISHETIYRACYRPQGGLGDDAHRLLCRPRRGRIRRRRTRSRRDPQPLGSIRLVTTRSVDPTRDPGHWEGDLLVGQHNRTATAVLTERHSRLVLLGALPQGRNSDHVTQVVAALLANVPTPLRQTLCWDQGRELTRWPHLEQQLGTHIYFCEPRSPWQKPLVENVCGLLRRWLPRNQPIPTDQNTLNHLAQLLNTMPRRSLGWHTAQTTYHALTGATAD